MSVDTLEYVKDLEAAGVDRRQAEAHAHALKKAVDAGLASKADLDAAVTVLRNTSKADLDAAVAVLRSDLSRVRADFEAALWKHTAGILLGVLAIGGLLLRFVR